LQCVSGYSRNNPIVAEILLQVSNPRTSGQSVVFCCVHGHCGLPGSEATVKAAKAADMHGPLVSDKALGTGICACRRRVILFSWQAEWDRAVGNKLHMVKPSVQEWQSSFRAVRKDEVTLTLVRIGHTRLITQTVVTMRAGTCLCNCGVPLTVVDCSCYAEARRICHVGGVICDIRCDNSCRVTNVLAFVTGIGLANSIYRIRFLHRFRILVPFKPFPSRLRHFTLPGLFTAWHS
jgi:hypothetical protein